MKVRGGADEVGLKHRVHLRQRPRGNLHQSVIEFSILEGYKVRGSGGYRIGGSGGSRVEEFKGQGVRRLRG